MATTQTTVVTSNLIVGAATSFQVDTTDLGGTSGGVTIEKKQTLTDLECDQVPGAVGEGVTDETFSVKTELPAVTLQNLQIAWGISAAPVTATTPASTTLNIGVERNALEHTLTFTGPAPGGKTRTFTFNRAVSMVAGAQTLDKKKQNAFPVEFKLLPDLTKAAGSEYGTIVDA